MKQSDIQYILAVLWAILTNVSVSTWMPIIGAIFAFAHAITAIYYTIKKD